MLEIKIGMDNFTGVACGVGFEASVARVDLREDSVQVKRLQALFRGTTVRNLDVASVGPGVKASSVPEVKPVPVPVSPQKVAPPAIVEQAPKEVPLAVGDVVLADYKDDMRRGRIVKVLSNGLLHVALDGDDAKHRVIDAEKVVRE
jgi:hypothetical protein